MAKSNEKREISVKPSRAVARLLAAELAQAHESFVRFYEDVYHLERKDAVLKVDEYAERARLRILEGPTRNISWIDLSQATLDGDDGGEAVMAAWDRLYGDALDEMTTGFRAAKVVSGGFDYGPADRARFLIVREALRAEWKPGPGSESTLVDMLAQIQVAWEHWFHQHMMSVQVTYMPLGRIELEAKRDNEFYPMRLTESQMYELSASLIDRFNKLYIRTLRALRDLRRMAPQVVVQNAGQVNVGEKQVNVQSAPVESELTED